MGYKENERLENEVSAPLGLRLCPTNRTRSGDARPCSRMLPSVIGRSGWGLGMRTDTFEGSTAANHRGQEASKERDRRKSKAASHHGFRGISSIPLFLIASEACAEARNSISRLEPSMFPEPATTPAENVWTNWISGERLPP
jgi:hypothetical protein